MTNKEFGAKFNPKMLWYCNDKTARKMMSEEMAGWWDEFGRITLPHLRSIVCSNTAT